MTNQSDIPQWAMNAAKEIESQIIDDGVRDYIARVITDHYSRPPAPAATVTGWRLLEDAVADVELQVRGQKVVTNGLTTAIEKLRSAVAAVPPALDDRAARQEVIDAAIELVNADTIPQPSLSRADAVRFGTARIYKAVEHLRSLRPASVAAVRGAGGEGE